LRISIKSASRLSFSGGGAFWAVAKTDAVNIQTSKGKIVKKCFFIAENRRHKRFENFRETVYFINIVPEQEKKSKTNLIKRLGVAGFFFFLIKGLLWLIIPALAAYFAW